MMSSPRRHMGMALPLRRRVTLLLATCVLWCLFYTSHSSFICSELRQGIKQSSASSFNASNGSCTKMPVYLKFHKVGSATVAQSILHTLQGAPYWQHKTEHCVGLPWEHSALQLYRLYGRAGIERSCLRAEYLACREEDLLFTAVFRNPLEKAISQFYFFHTALVKALKQSQNTSMEANAARAAASKFLGNSSDIDPFEMKSLFEYSKNHSFNAECSVIPHKGNGPGDLSRDSWTLEYEAVLSRYMTFEPKPFAPSEQSLKVALDNMATEFNVIGVTESMNSYWLLLSRMANLTFTAACGTNLNHGSWISYKTLFGSSKRPPAQDLFSPEVLAVLNNELSNEYTIWREAQRLHEEQLAALGLTVLQAEKEWVGICKQFLIEKKAAKKKGGA